MTTTDQHDLRFDVPLYSVAETAQYLGVPASTFRTWAKGYVRRPTGGNAVVGAPVLSVVAQPGPEASVP